MTNNQKRTLIIALIGFVVFSIIVFALPFDINSTFWVSYFFVLVSTVVVVYVMNYALLKDPNAKSKFYGFPLARLAVLYLALQVILSLIFDCFSRHIPAWIPTCVFFVLLGFVAIGLITLDAVREEVSRQEVEVKVNTGVMQNLRSIVYSLPARCADEDMKKKLLKLSEDFKYSDPVSSDALKEIEANLDRLIAQLKEAVDSNSIDTINKLCEDTKSVLEERNRLCRLNKGR